jgi:RNA polymerase sigma factor (sigma-70 family)
MGLPPSTPLSAPPCVTPRAEDATWFKAEVHPHDGLLKNYLRAKYPAVRDVDDVVQESYLRIWKAKANRPIASAKAFLFEVARHLALDVIRKNRNSPIDLQRDEEISRVLDTSPTAIEALLTKDMFHSLARAIAELPEKYRTIVMLHALKGLPQKEIAEQLGISVRTVEKHFAAGLRQCEANLHQQGIEGFRRQ